MNVLFAGSDGGEHWAVTVSLVEPCKRVGVDPQACFAEVIARIVEGRPQQRLDEPLSSACPSTPILKAVA
jgi:hypothetical protein